MARATFERGAKVKRWEQNLKRPRAALRQIGAMIVAESQAAFKAQEFDRQKWPPRSDVNVFGIIGDFWQGRRAPPARRFQRRPALLDTGRLAASIAFRLVSDDTVEAGSNLPYAGTHQVGGMSESRPITERVQTLLAAWLRRQDSARRTRLGWILNEKFTGQTLKMRVPRRRFIGITSRLRRDVKKVVRVAIMEVR